MNDYVNKAALTCFIMKISAVRVHETKQVGGQDLDIWIHGRFDE